ncbi:MAG TPA: penicillin-binding protein 2 [Chloroflexota bacterium]
MSAPDDSDITDAAEAGPPKYGREALDSESIVQLTGALAVAIVLLLLLSIVDDAAHRARRIEASGLGRGPIVDRQGRPLAVSQPHGTGAIRSYTIPGLAAALGFRDASGQWHGLEKTYSGYLDASAARSDWRTFFLHLRGEAATGNTLRLTLDRNVQQAAQSALRRANGAVVALDPRTGGVLALVSKPECSARQLSVAKSFTSCARRADKPLLDRAIGKVYAPGSAFKIVTLSAALDTRRFRLSDEFGGADAWGPSPYFDNTLYPSNVTRSDLTKLSLSQALAFSDNFTFAHIGLTLGARTLLSYAHRFLIGHRIPFDYPVRTSSIADRKTSPSKAEIAQSSFGAPTDQVTPLQMAITASVVANHGVLMAPHLLASVSASNGAMVKRYRVHALSRVMSAKAAAQVTSAMVFVVDHGSGFNAQIHGVKVAGKTGTADSGSLRPNAWFICFAPAHHPVIAVAVLHQYSGEGFEYAAPIARKVLVAGLRAAGYRVR